MSTQLRLKTTELFRYNSREAPILYLLFLGRDQKVFQEMFNKTTFETGIFLAF